MFSGSLVAIVTPMRPDGAVDVEAWARLLEFHLANGTNGIVVGGTSGESATLREAELRKLTQRACAQLRGRVAVIAGAGTSSTADTVERVGWLSALPIDGLLLVTPAYNRPTQERLYLHFAAAAAAARKPEMVAAALAGDGSEAQRLDERLSALHRELFVEANPIPVKWALAQMGLIASGIRLPLTPLAAQYQAGVRAAARAAGALP